MILNKYSFRGLIFSLSQNNNFSLTGVVTQTHLSRIAQKSLSVLCRVHADDRTKNTKKENRLRTERTDGLRKCL